MSESQALREKIHEANIAVHKVEAAYYERLHPEVYGKSEQQRIISALTEADKLVAENRKQALDFGAGTGNLTGKLLKLGYEVTAVDISPEMCEILRKKFKNQIDTKKLTVINAPIEDAPLGISKFDLICCYSVLHHLPDYESTLQRLCNLLKKGGVIYIDHEASPNYWTQEPTMLAEITKAIYMHSNPIINSLHYQLVGFRVPTMDYELSDYWHKKEHPINHQKIQKIFKTQKFKLCKRTDYHSKGTWVYNPIFTIYKLVCRPEMSCWIAKK